MKNKMKTKKSAAKRYGVTGTGKVYHRQQGLNHILSKKTSHRKRNLGMDAVLTGATAANAKELIPYK
ncbi:MAG TPA: 50S ribosomal protein L35 [Armatimonadota bacterium]|jgi:large subunit ribosomal protein L35